jgi:hypothetical protein
MRLLLLTAVLLLAPALRADEGEERVKVTEKDYGTYRTLLVAEDKSPEDLSRALAKAGWSQERYDKVAAALNSVAVSLAGPPEVLEQFDPTTVATAKAHRAEIEKSVIRQTAGPQLPPAPPRPPIGKPPTAAQLAGRWECDVEASMDLDPVAAAMDPKQAAALKAQMKPTMEQVLAGNGYVFGPSGAFQEISKGNPLVAKGTYRLEGNKLLLRMPSPLNPATMIDIDHEAGMRGPLLILRSPTGDTAYRKK